MKKIQLSYFQQQCDIILKTVNQTNKPVIITDKGKFLVKIVPVSTSEQNSWLGCMNGTGKIINDIISPAESLETWEVLSE